MDCRQLSLLFERKIRLHPIVPPAFESVNFTETSGQKLPRRPGAGLLIRSGTVKDQGFFFRVLARPRLDIFLRVLTDGTLDFPIRHLPFLFQPNVHDDDARIA
jgi:hypothetical protein